MRPAAAFSPSSRPRQHLHDLLLLSFCSEIPNCDDVSFFSPCTRPRRSASSGPRLRLSLRRNTLRAPPRGRPPVCLRDAPPILPSATHHGSRPVGSLTTTSAPDEPAPRGIPAGCLADQTEDHSHPPADQPAPRGVPAGCLADPTEDDPRITLTPPHTQYQAFPQPWWPQGGQVSGAQGSLGVTTEPAGRRFTICAAITIQYRS